MYSQSWSAWPRCDHGRLVIFMLAGTAAVDIVRAVGFVKTEVKALRKGLENARAIAANATSAVNVLVDMKEVVDVGRSGSVVSDIRKRGSRQPGGASGLYMGLS